MANMMDDGSMRGTNNLNSGDGEFCWVCPLQLVISERIGLNPTIYLFKWVLD